MAERGTLIAVRGNCDAEVDQMVLDFPCMADYAELVDEEGRTLFLTHGHVYGAGFHNSVENLPALPAGSAILYGHTHVKVSEPVPDQPTVWRLIPAASPFPRTEATATASTRADVRWRRRSVTRCLRRRRRCSIPLAVQFAHRSAIARLAPTPATHSTR